MEKTTLIVLIAIRPSTSYTTDVRKICNEIEGIEIQVPNHIVKAGEFVHTHIRNEYPTLAYDDVQVYGLGDFMALNNDEEYHADEWFMSYVFSK